MPLYPQRLGAMGSEVRRIVFSRLARRSLTLRRTLAPSPIRDALSEGFSHFVTSIAAPVASGWSVCRVGFAPTGKRRLCTTHTYNGHRPTRDARSKSHTEPLSKDLFDPIECGLPNPWCRHEATAISRYCWWRGSRKAIRCSSTASDEAAETPASYAANGAC